MAWHRANYYFSTPRRPGKYPFSRSTFYTWISEGKLPPGKKLSERIRVFDEGEMDAAIENLIERGGTAA